MLETIQNISVSRKKYSDALKKIQWACRVLFIEAQEAIDARKYADERISLISQEDFGIGYFPPDDKLDLLYSLVPREYLEKTGLVYQYHVQNDNLRQYMDRGVLSEHNLTLPYLDQYGTMVGLMGRTLLSEQDRKQNKLQKYKYARGPTLIPHLHFKKTLHLFGTDQARQAIQEKGSVIVVEGQLDCIACHEHGIRNVVGLGGTSLTKYQFNLLRRLTDRIHLLLDNDQPGQSAQEKIIRRYSGQVQIDGLVIPPEYKDVDDYLRAGNDLKIE